MWQAIINYFVNDPLKILYLLGGTGGVWFWAEKWLDRRRLKIRLLGHSFDPIAGKVQVKIEFEAVNIGKLPTSLEPDIYCSGYTPKREYVTGKFTIEEPERQLSPHSTQQFTGVGDFDSQYPFWIFRTYHISLTRGSDRAHRSRRDPRKRIGLFQYDLEVSLFRWFGVLPFMETRRSDD